MVQPARMRAVTTADSLPPATVRHVRRALLRWFDVHRRDLPWRRSRDSYRVWVSEVMLQQTRIAVVVPAYERFMARFPTLPALAAASEDEVLSLWSGLGYYRRARALHRAARQLTEEGVSVFPTDLAAALRLPGVGRYTAAAVLSIAHDAPLAAVDGNVTRVLSRLYRSAALNVERAAAALLDPARPGDWNQAIMELGQHVCTPRAVCCDACPLRPWCPTGEAGDAERWPRARERRPVERVELHAIVVRDETRRLLLERGAFAALPHLWLPLLREDEKEVRRGDRDVGRVTHAIVHRSFRVHVHLREVTAHRLEAMRATRSAERRVFRPDELMSIGRSSLLTKVLRLVDQPA